MHSFLCKILISVEPTNTHPIHHQILFDRIKDNSGGGYIHQISYTLLYLLLIGLYGFIQMNLFSKE